MDAIKIVLSGKRKKTMNEYEARLKNIASTINEMRATSGATATTLMFSLLSSMLAKNKITEKDLDIIFEVEKGQARQTFRSYFDQNYGDPDFELKNAKEMEDALVYVVEYIELVKENVKLAAESLRGPRRKKKEEKDAVL